MSSREALRRLADEAGILPRYLEQTGKRWIETSDETREKLLAAMGLNASTEAAAREELSRLERARRGQLVDPIRVARQVDDDARTVKVSLPRPDADVNWELELQLENGETYRVQGSRAALGGRSLEVELPLVPPLGYHAIRLAIEQRGESHAGDQTLVVVPAWCTRPAEVAGHERTFGIVANLYSVMTPGNWGVGDMSDLRELAEWSATLGATFVGVNPLHSLLNRGDDISPYSPVTRLFRNPIYIDVERAAAHWPGGAAARMVRTPTLETELARLRSCRSVDYEGVMRLKLPVLRQLHHDFLDTATRPQLEEYRRWCAGREPELTDYATYMLIALGDRGIEARGPDWRRWPRELRDVRGAGVGTLREKYPVQLDLHRWMQFELDRQMGEVAVAARAAGLRIGLYQDLAIGTNITGSDVWSNPELFVSGASVGAPPDPYSATGQNWGLPPIHPQRLREGRYRYWVSLLRSAFRHAGALRIDHVLGLFRQFWIPEGGTGRDGAYVRFPAEEMLGILALESVRHRAVVVGEDLGTVPEEVPVALRRWCILSSKVLLFEREEDGRFRDADAYIEQSLATANTHDMPPLEGFWNGLDIPDRVRFGFIPADAEAAARDTRCTDREQLRELLVESKVLDPELGDPSGAEIRGAVHDFLALTPAALMGISLDDIAGETEPVNIPGTSPEQRPNWTRRMNRTLAEIRASEDARIALGRRVREERR